jgi:hypothetical protein
MANDASFNDAQWSDVRSDITSLIGGIAGVFLEHLVYLLGTGGLTNLARSGGASSGDCSTCPSCDPCDSVDFLTSTGSYTTSSDSVGTRGEWVSGQGWKQTYHDNGLDNNRLYIISPDLSACEVTGLRVYFELDAIFPHDAGYYPVGCTLHYIGGTGGDVTLNIEPDHTGSYNIFFTTDLGDNTAFSLNCSSVACDYRITGIDYHP